MRENRKIATEIRPGLCLILYTCKPMAVETAPRERAQDTGTDSYVLRAQRSQIVDQCRAYIEETFREKGVAGESETRQLETWIQTQDASAEGVKSLKDFYEGFLRKQLSSGRELHQDFYRQIDAARANGWISQKSYDKWVERFRDKSAGYKTREAWVKGHLPKYVQGWKKCAEERSQLLADVRFPDLVAYDPSFAAIKKEDFIDLHYDKRAGILADARAALGASERTMLDLYAKAKSKLAGAVSAGFLGQGKDGVWLERMMKSKADPKKIEAFVNGTAKNSLSDLMINWFNVKKRFDTVTEKANERGADTAARGFKLISANQFLAMDYPSRVQYVGQAEQRLGDAKNVATEQPIFLKIRHAMDMKDWNDADLLIAQAKTMHLKDSDWPRLKSMEKYVTQFKGGKEKSASSDKVADAKKRLDMLMERVGQSHSEVQPLISRLLKSNHANRNIHQFRWVWYNNIWCRTHGPPYLNDEVARKGSSEDNEQLTKHRAEQGLDVGRHDVLDYETADHAYFRKQETSKHKATFMHANVNSGGVQSAFAEKMEHEQDPKWLYWTTFCPHSNGEPKSEAWMREGLMILTEMRSLTRTINDAGFRYEGANRKLAQAA